MAGTATTPEPTTPALTAEEARREAEEEAGATLSAEDEFRAEFAQIQAAQQTEEAVPGPAETPPVPPVATPVPQPPGPQLPPVPPPELPPTPPLTPPLPVQEPVSPPPPETDPELDALPAEDPTSENWRKVREINKDRKHRIAELEAQVTQLQAAPPPASAPPVPPAPAAPALFGTTPEAAPAAAAPATLDPGFLFQTLAEAQAGDETAAKYAFECREALRGISTADLVGVQQRARANGFGDVSEEVLVLCRDYAPEIQLHEQQAQVEREAQRDADVQRATAWGEALQGLPELRNQQSAQFQAFSRANAELLVQLPKLWDSPRAPRIVAEYLGLRSLAGNAQQLQTQVAKLTQENGALKARLGIAQAPPGGGQPPTPPDVTPDLSATEELKQDFAALGIRRK